MRFYVGKLKEVSLAANPSNIALSIPRVPISSVAFKPQQDDHGHEYTLLTAGGSAVALWKLKTQPISDPPVDTVLPVAAPIQVKTEVDEEQDLKVRSAGVSPTDARWLHANASGARVTAERLGFYSDHAPDYVIRVQWSETGTMWASADGKRVIVFAKKSPEEESSWQRLHCILEPAVQEIFDFSFVHDDRLVVGGFGRACIRTLPDVRPEASLTMPLEDGEFVKGIASRRMSPGTYLICIGSSHKRAKIYVYDAVQNVLALLMMDQTLFADGPSDHPGLRYTSIDPTGRLVAFAYGARKHDTFGALYDLQEMKRAAALKAEVETYQGEERESMINKITEIETDAKYRVRGHQTRINCVAFSNRLRPMQTQPSEFLLRSKSDVLPEPTRLLLVEEMRKLDAICVQNPRWPRYVSYAQASIEGLLSIWRVFLPSEPEQTISGLCLSATPHMLVDQTGLISSMDWSSDDKLLVVGSDDGKLTCLYFEDELMVDAPPHTTSVGLVPESTRIGSLDEPASTAMIS